LSYGSRAELSRIQKNRPRRWPGAVVARTRSHRPMNNPPGDRRSRRLPAGFQFCSAQSSSRMAAHIASHGASVRQTVWRSNSSLVPISSDEDWAFPRALIDESA